MDRPEVTCGRSDSTLDDDTKGDRKLYEQPKFDDEKRKLKDQRKSYLKVKKSVYSKSGYVTIFETMT